MEASDLSEMWNLSTKINSAAYKKTINLILASVGSMDVT
jgi:hypothetical protein